MLYALYGAAREVVLPNGPCCAPTYAACTRSGARARLLLGLTIDAFAEAVGRQVWDCGMRESVRGVVSEVNPRRAFCRCHLMSQRVRERARGQKWFARAEAIRLRHVHLQICNMRRYSSGCRDEPRYAFAEWYEVML